MSFFDKFKKKKEGEIDTSNLSVDLDFDDSIPLDEAPSGDTKSTSISEFDYLKDDDISKIEEEKKSEELDDFSDIINAVDTTSKTLVVESTEKEMKKIEEETKKEVKKEVQKSYEKQFRALSPKTKAVMSNLFLIFSLVISLYLVYWTIVPTLSQIEVYKSDKVKVQKDLAVVDKNLQLLQESTKDAFEYRRLNDLLEQAVPLTDKYEDNIIVILNLLKDSITKYSRNEKLLQSLSVKPNVEIKDIEYFQLDWEKILGIEYSMSIDGFEKYQYIKDFLDSIDDRLKVFHIQSLNISKVLNRETQKTEYSVWFTMYSYYKVPKIWEDWEVLEKENIENTFK